MNTFSRQVKNNEWVQEAGQPDSCTFAWMGDVQGDRESDSPAYIRALQSISAMENKPAFLVIGGDMTEMGDSDTKMRNYFLNPLDTYLNPNIPIVPIVGNHDWYHDYGDGDYGEGRCGGPDRWQRMILPLTWDYIETNGKSYFSFDYCNSHFTVLNMSGLQAETAPNINDVHYLLRTHDGLQREWLENEMTQTGDRRGEIGHYFVIGHYNLIKLGAEPVEVDNMDSDYGFYLLHRFAELGVDAYLCGHYHYYFRQDVYGVSHICCGGTTTQPETPPAGTYFDHYLLVDVTPSREEPVHIRIMNIDGSLKDGYDLPAIAKPGEHAG